MDMMTTRYSQAAISVSTKFLKATCGNNMAWCKKCQTYIHVIDSITAIDHVTLVHSKQSGYQCNQCSFIASDLRSLFHHIGYRHGLVPGGNYIDQKFEWEITGLLSQCFDCELGTVTEDQVVTITKDTFPSNCEAGNKTGNRLESVIQIHDEEPISPSGSESSQAIATRKRMRPDRTSCYHIYGIRNHCVDIIRRNTTNGLLQCQLCPHKITINRTDRKIEERASVNHAYGHFQISVYHCKFCPYTGSRRALTGHLRDEHAEPSGGNFINRSDLYKYQLMHMVSVCFEKSIYSQSAMGSMADTSHDMIQNSGNCDMEASGNQETILSIPSTNDQIPMAKSDGLSARKAVSICDPIEDFLEAWDVFRN